MLLLGAVVHALLCTLPYFLFFTCSAREAAKGWACRVGAGQ